MKTYLTSLGTRETPQSEPILGSEQVPNSAGGYAWAVDDWVRLDRFLVLSSEGGSYYATERALSLDNAQAVLRAIRADGPRAVARIVEVSDRDFHPPITHRYNSRMSWGLRLRSAGTRKHNPHGTRHGRRVCLRSTS